MAQPAQQQTELDIYLNGANADTGAGTSKVVQNLINWSERDNLADEMDRTEIDELKHDLDKQYGEDLLSMKEWKEKYKNAFTLAKMKTHAEIKQKPFQGAAKVMAPYIFEAAVDFNARIISETISVKNPVKAEIFGKDTPQKKARAKRTSRYMNYKLTTNDHWIEDTDTEFMTLPIIGSSYKKTYYDPHTDTNESRLVIGDRLVFSHDAPTFEEARMHTEDLDYTKNDIAANLASDLWIMEDRDKLDEEKINYEFREYHYWHDMDGDGFEEPYIGTYCIDTDEIVRVVARYDEDSIRDFEGKVVSIEQDDYFTQKILIPDPEGKPYGMGWGILLHDIYETINTNVRQLIDAGTLANSASNTGIIAATLEPMLNQPGRMQEGTIELEMGRIRTIQTASGSSLRDSFVQMPFAGPQPALFELMKYLEESARRMAIASFSVEANPGEAASLYLARLQQALKAPNTMTWRVMRGLTKELKKLQKLFYKYGSNEDYNRVLDDYEIIPAQEAPPPQPGQPPQPGTPQQSRPVTHDIRRDFDYRDCDILPTADPSQGSEIERAMKVQAIDQMSDRPYAQGVLNGRELVKRNLESMNEPDIETLMPPPATPQPDPLLEQQKAYMEMERQFRDREMRMKEQELLLKQSKQAIEARKILVELGHEDKKTDAEVANKVADTLKKVAEAAALDMENGLGRLKDAQVTLITDNGDNLNGRLTQGPTATTAGPAIKTAAATPTNAANNIGRPGPLA